MWSLFIKKENPLVLTVNRLLKNAKKDLEGSKKILARVRLEYKDTSLEEIINERLAVAAKKLGKTKLDLEPFGKFQLLVNQGTEKIFTQEEAEKLLKDIFGSGDNFFDFLASIGWKKERKKIEAEVSKSEN